MGVFFFRSVSSLGGFFLGLKGVNVRFSIILFYFYLFIFFFLLMVYLRFSWIHSVLLFTFLFIYLSIFCIFGFIKISERFFLRGNLQELGYFFGNN